MNLRELAAKHHRLFVEDKANGFGRELRFVTSNNQAATVTGYWNDIGQQLDLQTGALVAGTTAFVRVTLGALRQAGIGMPEAVNDTNRRPWTVSYKDMAGREHTFKINDVRPDRSVDAVDCYLEQHR